MKRNIILFVAAAVTLLLAASCNRKVEYQYEKYATLYHSSFTVAENAGELRIPVLVKNTKGADVQVSVKIAEGTAVEGVDYEVVSPANGILSFSGDTDSLDVVINLLTPALGEFTGAKNFTVSVASATEGVGVGLISNANVIIDDVDHPLAAFIGTWSGNMLGKFQNPEWPTQITVSADPNGDPFTDLIFDGGINPYFVAAIGANPPFSAKVDGNLVTVFAEQPMGYSDVILLGFDHADSSAATSYDHARFELQEDGTLVQLNAFGAYTPSGGGFYEIYLGGAVFTKN